MNYLNNIFRYSNRFNNNQHLSHNNQQDLQDRNVVIERHIIPADLYQQWYLPQNINLNRQNTTQFTNNSNINIPSHLYRRSERMNNNLGQTLSDLLYGSRNTSNISSSNNSASSNVTSNTSSTNTSNLFTNMRFLVRDSNGNQVNYNMNIPSSNSSEFNSVSDLLTRMMDPTTPLDELFDYPSSQQQNIPLTQEQINNNTTIIHYYLYDDNTSEDNDIDEDNESNNGIEYDSCTICRENYLNNEEIRIINNCNHNFHRNCIDEWLTNHKTCPICRGNIIPNENNT